jgi:hypothetical protein
MATYNYAPGLGNVGSFQVSGKPWVSSSLTVPAESGDPLQVRFSSVTKEVTVRNDSAGAIRVGFSAAGISGSATNYFTLASSGSFTSPIKVVDVFLISDDSSAGEATVVASLTGIDVARLQTNWTGSEGIG